MPRPHPLRPSVGVLLIGVLLASPQAAAGEAPDSKQTMVAVDVVDVYQANDGSHVVVLKTRTKPARVVPIWIGENEAFAIWQRLNRRKAPRPLTHDLFEKVFGRLDAKIEKVHVDDLRGSVFLGRIFLRHAGGTFDIDARPSDSIALAVGAGAPVFVSVGVLERSGEVLPERGKEGQTLPRASEAPDPGPPGPGQGTRL